MLVPQRPDERWSLDFVSDQLTDGRRFRILTVVDDCTRECLALVVDTSLSGILALIKQGERVYADETTLPTLSPGAGKTKTAWLWTYARDDRTFGGPAPPMVAYRFEDNCGGACVERHLAGYSGLLQVDGWGAYNRLAEATRSGGLRISLIVSRRFTRW
jgi:hypothetical protein